MMPPQGTLSIERMCGLTGVSRRSYYRHWQHTAPRDEETALRDTLQRLALAHRFYGYRRVTEAVRREGWAVNHKRVLRLMRTEICSACAGAPSCPPPPTPGTRGGWCRTWPAAWS